MKNLTKKQQQEIKEIEAKVSEVCDTKNQQVVIDEKTGIPYLSTMVNPNKSREIEISLTFDPSVPSLKKQLKSQGFKIEKQAIKKAELIRQDLLALRKVNILKEKELIKCFERLSRQVCKYVIDSQLKEGEKAIHKSTKLVK